MIWIILYFLVGFALFVCHVIHVKWTTGSCRDVERVELIYAWPVLIVLYIWAAIIIGPCLLVDKYWPKRKQ